MGPFLAGISPNFGGLSDVSITIGVSYSTKRRRAIKKRAIGYIVLIIEFIVVFKPKCTGKCQTDTGNSIRTLLPDKVTVNTVVLTNIILVDKSGESVGVIVAIPVLEVLYISVITPVVISRYETTEAPPTIFTVTSTTRTTTTPTTTATTTTEASYPVSLPEEVKYLGISASDWFNNERLDQYIQCVALAGRCYHQPAQFRHRNMYLISKDHLPLELQNHINVKSNSLRRLSSEINISSGTAKLFPLAMIQQKSNPYVRDDTIFIKIMVHVGDMSKAPIHIQQLLIKKEV
ncbi:unnamed protein product [Rotaria socialis]|uniref:Uncharacterized protein n=1 Tax=Rotaria socialis TaxID=392032 RepID=A0A820VYW7_9BILA|nr:unnamed protein product [Rotaria socialis]